MNLHQFSFTKYDDTNYEVMEVNGKKYPAVVDEYYDGDFGTVYQVVWQDRNFYDVVVYNHQKELIQKCWTDFINKVNKEVFGKEGRFLPSEGRVKAEVTPNYYGSIFIVFSGAWDDVKKVIEWIDKQNSEENISFNEFMPFKYEEIIVAYNIINGYQNYTDHNDYSKEDYQYACEMLGFEPSEEEEGV